MSNASTTALPSGAAHGTAHTPSIWNASDNPCAAMKAATHSARSAAGRIDSSFAGSPTAASGAAAAGGGPSSARAHPRPAAAPRPGTTTRADPAASRPAPAAR